MAVGPLRDRRHRGGIGAATRKVVETIGFGVKGISGDRIRPGGIALTGDGRFAFAALGPSDRVAVTDARTCRLLSSILVGRRVRHLALMPEQDRLLATGRVSGDVAVIDVASPRPVGSITVGRFPWRAAVRPSGAAPAENRSAGAAEQRRGSPAARAGAFAPAPGMRGAGLADCRGRRRLPHGLGWQGRESSGAATLP